MLSTISFTFFNHSCIKIHQKSIYFNFIANANNFNRMLRFNGFLLYFTRFYIFSLRFFALIYNRTIYFNVYVQFYECFYNFNFYLLFGIFMESFDHYIQCHHYVLWYVRKRISFLHAEHHGRRFIYDIAKI